MTKRSKFKRSDQVLMLEPVLVPKVWGGRRLPALFGTKAEGPIGEAWLVSDHPTAPTRVSWGPMEGLTLGEALREIGLLDDAGGFPLLVKLIESREPLSIQVHPNDSLARELEGADRGKSEAWHVLESAGGHVGLGFGQAPPDRSIEFLQSDDLAGWLRKHELRGGEFIYVPAGEIHYIGPGVLLAEVQQSSDITYRIQDWGRVGRELHLERAARSLNWSVRPPEDLVRWQPDAGAPGGPWPFEMTSLELPPGAELAPVEHLRVLLPLRGEGHIQADSDAAPFRPYHCCVLPPGVGVRVDSSASTAWLICSPRPASKSR